MAENKTFFHESVKHKKWTTITKKKNQQKEEKKKERGNVSSKDSLQSLEPEMLSEYFAIAVQISGSDKEWMTALNASQFVFQSV